MAYIPMTIGGKKYTETSLWTNSSPTSNFASQTVTLSDNISKYKYIKITYRDSTSVDQVGILILDSANFATQATSPNYYNFPAMVSSTSSYARALSYSSDTQIVFGNTARINYASSQNNAYAIPLEILGLNELDHGIMGADLLWTNPNPGDGNGFAAQTVSLDLSGYDAIILRTGVTYGNYPTGTFPASNGDQILIPKANVGDICFGYFASGGSYYATHRTVSVDDSGVTFGTGYQNATAIATRALPLAIYGVKNSIP